MFLIFLSALLFCAFSPFTAEGRLRQFYVGDNKPTNISDAEKKCKQNSSNLVTVYDQQDNCNLIQLLKKNSHFYGWIGVFSGNRSQKWSNGDDNVTYAKKKYKSNVGQETLCATMKSDGNWDSIICNENISFMCYERDAGGTYNYTLITLNKTWFDAQLYCRENHIDLVSIRDDKENQLVWENRAMSNNPFWIGLLDDTVEWKDGGRSAYRNWKSLPPQITETYILRTDGKWPLKGGQYVPICQKSLIHVSNYTMPWEEAMDYCKENYSRPLHFLSENDQLETERELRRKKISSPVWVGLRQSLLFGFWIWNNGLQVGSWTNWKGGITPQNQLSQHCGAIEKVDREYKLSDKDCRSRFRVLCEIE